MKILRGFSALLTILVVFTTCDSGGGDAVPAVVLFSENFSAYAEMEEPADWVYLDGTNSTSAVTGTEKALRVGIGAEASCAIYDAAATAGWTDYELSFKFKASSAMGTFVILLRTDPQSQPANAFYQVNIGYTGTAPENYSYIVGKELASSSGS